ncbi:hypothetical protein [Massilia horti]|uniref:Secreted protein n=1 Tax=Massilia horti TaxID=2562153 RepID=A0A4Y9T5N2_9BURK|nr:hypothetical protein [Massilia horti]TFW33795.1 hypothetical protein E4O92_05555 [Massilia horti]
MGHRISWLLPLVLLAWEAYAQEPGKLAEPPDNPTARDCIAINRQNARLLKDLSDQHAQCLHEGTTSAIDYLAARPCSRLACRDLHLNIAALIPAIGPIADACKARVKPPLLGFLQGKAEDAQLMAGKLADSGKLIAQVTRLEQQRQLANEQPWQVAQAAWGDSATFLRNLLTRSAANGRPQDDPDWLMYDLLFNKKGEPAGRLATNPIGKLVTDNMLARLRATEAGLQQAAATTADQVVNLFEATRLPPALVVPGPGASVPAGQQPVAPECALFEDMDKSRALLASDPGEWERLNMKCHP